MLMDILLKLAQVWRILIKKLSSHGSVQLIKMILNQAGTKTLTPYIKIRISMEFQDNLLQDKNLIGQMVMAQDLKNLMLMVISLKLAQVKKISIKKQNNHGFNQEIVLILLQCPILWVSL
jgi:hypothetical protein